MFSITSSRPSISAVASILSWGTVFVGSAAVYRLVRPLLAPTVWAFPWWENRKEDKLDCNRTVIMAGSYNPPHKGHLAMIQFLAHRYKQVIVVVGINPNKKYQVTPHERADLLWKMVEDASNATNMQRDPITNVRVEVVQGYIWRFAKKQGASRMFRGIRSWERDGAEERALLLLNTWGPLICGPLVWPIDTIYLQGDPVYNHISSTLIRDICNVAPTNNDKSHQSTISLMSGDAIDDHLSKLVPESIAKDVKRLYCRM